MVSQPIVTSGTYSRRERLRTMMRSDILEAALAIIQEHGYKELSMRALGRAVGVTAPTLYDYFANKDAVLDALYVEGVIALKSEFEEIAVSDDTAGHKLNRIAHAYRGFAQTRPDIFMLVFGRVDANYRPTDEAKHLCMTLMDPIRATVVQAITDGEMRPVDPDAAGHFLWNSVHGFVMLEVNKVLDKADCEQLDLLFEVNLQMLSDGLRPFTSA